MQSKELPQGQTTIPTLSVLQGLYFIATGIWPIAHIESFLKVTGPKRDLWLVKSFGVLTASIGTAFLVANQLDQTSRIIPVLGLCTAVALAGIDINYAGKKVISPIYLVDAAVQAIFIANWIIHLW